jgi:hypothetical protein
MRKFKLGAALIAALALAVSAPAAAFGVGGPNEAGNSGKFHPKSGPCASDNNHPHCPGPH